MATKRPTRPRPPSPVGPSVPPEIGITLLQKLIEKAQALHEKQDLQFSDCSAWENLARDYLRKVFGSDSPNVDSVLNASGDEGLYTGMSNQEYQQYLRAGFENKVKLLNSCIEQLETDIALQKTAAGQSELGSPAEGLPTSSKVFVVHGLNQGVKEAVARFLEKLDLEAIILHEKPNAGRTVIEKFADYADVQFAVVLLTADDEGRVRGNPADPMLRARQNVILELGYFLGKLGRARVCALYEADVEIPSDYQGVLFVELDKSDRWKFELVRELHAAGFDVDANRIFAPD